ncbi:MAG: lipase maturation factor family protein [Candidatus Omnitrophica bacterium]|nr:lipase maturation factor family protein [Candidatus Omnitrophota bacterium]
MNQTNTYFIARRFFIRFLGIIYFIAFASIGVQIKGLIGSHGILPVGEYFQSAEAYYGYKNFFGLPTLFWFNHSDWMLVAICVAALIICPLLIIGFYPAVCLFLLWFFYLSIVHVGQTFLSFQWDVLLLEVGFLSIFLAPWNKELNTFEEPPPRWIIFAFHLLLFKLMFQSGLVKLASGDEHWLDLTALTYHYYTQPLPNLLSWYAYQQPFFIQQISCIFMFVVELIIPWGIFMNRETRLWSCATMMILQILIMLSGNYGFFNLLAIAMCFLLIDDNHFRKRIYDKAFASWGDMPKQFQFKNTKLSRMKDTICQVVVGILITMTFLNFIEIKSNLPPKVAQGMKILRPFLINNNYGLFANMTTQRLEIIVEGSNDGNDWKAYEFKFKPGNVFRAPIQVAPHQPRLDWQMWFAALTPDYTYTPWFSNFLKRLLEGEKSVLNLLFIDPFSDKPPKYIRAKIYNYEFTTNKMFEKSKEYWTRKENGFFAPVIQLNE